MTLVDGPRQVAPAEAITVVDVPFSISPTGQRQRAVTVFEPKTLAAFRPTWVSDTPGVVRQWAPDATDPKVFWVYPPAVAGNKAEIAYPVAPPEVITQDVIPMDSTWAPAIMDYCLGRALGKDAEFAADPARAAFYMTAFYKRFPSDSST
jgi:hypothetical protein